MLVVDAQPLQLVLWRFAASEVLGLGDEDPQDWLEQGRVEVEGDVNQTEGPVL